MLRAGGAQLAEDDQTALTLAQADRNDADEDALTWYRAEFIRKLGTDNSEMASIRCGSLFVMLLGLGMRESSGRYCEGRDFGTNVSADTAEAGMYQTS